MNEQDVLGAFLLVNNPIVLSEEETKDVQKAIKKLQQENRKQKEIIDKIVNLIKQYGKYDGKKCIRGFQMWSADFNKILDILNEVSE